MRTDMTMPMAGGGLALADRIAADKAELSLMTEELNESTALTWLWAFLFGPLYFVFHGFWGRAFIVFMLNVVLIGWLVSPFLAYPAWRKRAELKAERMMLLDRVSRR